MQRIEKEINSLLREGAQITNEFSGKIRRFYGFEVGDVFTIDPSVPVFTEKFDYDVVSQYTLVVNQYGEVRKLYPTLLDRKVVNENHQRVYSTGSVVDFYKSFDTVAEGMKMISGKAIRVSDIQHVRTPMGTVRQVYKFDFV